MAPRQESKLSARILLSNVLGGLCVALLLGIVSLIKDDTKDWRAFKANTEASIPQIMTNERRDSSALVRDSMAIERNYREYVTDKATAVLQKK